MGLPRQSWIDAEPGRVDIERAAMAALAPDMEWVEDPPASRREGLVGWVGKVPAWASDRPKPRGVDELLGDQRLVLSVIYSEAFPIVPPALVPLEPEVPIIHRTMQQWHVNGDGSLCVMQAAADWHPNETAADLVVKASGWFVEYLLMERGAIERMTVPGLHASKELDEILSRFSVAT